MGTKYKLLNLKLISRSLRFFAEEFDMTDELWYHALVFLDKYRQEIPEKDEFYNLNDQSGK